MLEQQFSVAGAAGPLGVGHLIEVATDDEPDLDQVLPSLAHAGLSSADSRHLDASGLTNAEADEGLIDRDC
jgi:hypothetical protein